MISITDITDLKNYAASLAILYQERANALCMLKDMEQKQEEAKYQIYAEIADAKDKDGNLLYKTATDREYQAKNRLTQDKTTYSRLEWEKAYIQKDADLQACKAKYEALKAIVEASKE